MTPDDHTSLNTRLGAQTKLELVPERSDTYGTNGLQTPSSVPGIALPKRQCPEPNIRGRNNEASEVANTPLSASVCPPLHKTRAFAHSSHTVKRSTNIDRCHSQCLLST